MPYDESMVAPMRQELSRIGVKELKTASEVDAFFGDKKGTALLVVNSVCGCAAGQARPGVALALAHKVKPDRAATVFAGQDTEATQKARSYFPELPPSSPSFALLKDGKVVHFVPRHMIESQPPQSVAANLIGAFEKHCAAQAKA